MSKAKKIALGIIAAFVLYIVLVNLETTRVGLLPGVKVEMPLFLVLLFAFGAGAITALVWSWISGGKEKKKEEPPPKPPPTL